MEVECACGCGEKFEEMNKWGKKRKYVKGHNNKGKKFSDEHRKKLCEARVDYRHSEETKIKMSESGKGRKHSDESKLKMSIAKKGKYTGENNHNFGKKFTEERRKNISEGLKGKYTGENCPAWKGGLSFEPYCHHFNEQYKEKIRNHYGRVCFLCGKTEIDNGGKKLSVHHADYNKQCGCDDSICKCVPLCMSCHAKTSGGNRDYWEQKITSKLNPDFALSDVLDIKPLTDFFK